jgi:tryptophan synthase beta chain
MVNASYQQKPYRRSMMETWGSSVVASPSKDTQAGNSILADHPDSPGSLGIAISEAVEDAATREDTKYALGSVLNHVLMHQTVIGQECKAMFEKIDDYPDMVIGCVGGGSSFAGIAFPFVKDKLNGTNIQLIAVEPEAAPSISRGVYAYDFGDTVGLTPLVKMFTLGHTFVPPAIHAGGLRYHGMAPLISLLCDQGIVEARAEHQNTVFEAAVLFAKTEGIIPAPEPSHAIKVAIEEAIKCREAGEAKTILFNLCGHGYFDMSAYDAYLSGNLEDYAYPRDAIEEAMKSVPQL